MILYGDIETYSEIDLKQVGAQCYARHPSTEVTLFAWAVGDGPVHVWDCTAGNMPVALGDAIRDADEYVFHNANFDRTVLLNNEGFKWQMSSRGSYMRPEKFHCTMIRAMAHGLPGALGTLGELYGLEGDEAKDKDGRRLVLKFCKPDKKGVRRTRETDPEDWAKFVSYAGRDVTAMRHLYKRLPRLNTDLPAEKVLIDLDRRINDRGLYIDMDLVHGAIAAVDREQANLRTRVQEQTDDMVESATKGAQLLAFILEEFGVRLPDLQASTLERRLEDDSIPEPVKELLRIRLEASRSSTAKYKVLARATTADNRLRGLLQIYGAQRTGRYAGRLFQPQNLKRPNEKNSIIERNIEAIKGGVIDLIHPAPMEACANAIRGVITAPPSKKLVVADLSNIEGRVLAWLAGEEWKLQAFREFDEGTGHDLYALAYAKSFGITPEEVMDNKKNGDGVMRQVGKVMELACVAKGTLVLTDVQGWIRIEDVTLAHRLWDGEEWVCHQGLAYRGEKEVINLNGIEVTADHLLLTQQTWQQASHIVSNGSDLFPTLVPGSESLSSKATSMSDVEALIGYLLPALSAEQKDTVLRYLIWLTESLLAAIPALKRRPATGGKNTTDTQTSALTTNTAVGFSTEYPQQLTGAVIRTIADMLTTAEEEYMYTPYLSKIGARFCATLSHFLGGTTPLWKWIESTWTKAMSLETFALLRELKTPGTRGRSAIYKAESLNLKRKMPTYDIVCCGPRARFTVLTSTTPALAHNCGYQGGAAAFRAFADVYRLDLGKLAEQARKTIPPEVLAEAKDFYKFAVEKKFHRGMPEHIFVVCESLKRLWRSAHPRTVELWSACDNAFRAALDTPNVNFHAGHRIIYRRSGSWMYARLPSGRVLCYPQPRLEADSSITFMGINQYTRKWERLTTSPGRLAENADQAIARDVITASMPVAEHHGYEIVLTVHDELVTEAPDSDEFNADHLAAIMSDNTGWRQGLPLAAAGYEGYRYRKD